MLLFGHTGLTLGAAAILNRLFAKDHPARTSWFTSLRRRVDSRLLLIGSLLPDIIDKPLGILFFHDTFSSGRIFGHTLVFLIAITLASLWLYRERRQTWLLVLAFGSFTHLVFDRMWLHLQTLFWPLYGWSFPATDLSTWLQDRVDSLFSLPNVYVPEIIGVLVLLWFGLDVVKNRRRKEG